MKKLVLTICAILGALFADSTIAADYSGWYEGTFDGTDIGMWRVSISQTHRVEGTGYSQQMGQFKINGALSELGQLKMTIGIATTGAIFDGHIDNAGQVRGVWRNTGATGGSFSGVRNQPL